MRARIDPTDGTKYSLGMFTQHADTFFTGSEAGWVNGLTPGQTVFVVGAFNVGASNSARIWVNPDPLTFGLVSAPTPTAQDLVSGTNGGTIGSFLLHQRNLVPDLAMDELRVATRGRRSPRSELPRCTGTLTAPQRVPGGATPSGTWDGATANWNNSAAGDGNALTWTPGGAATFSAGSDATGSYTITVSGTQSASQVTFEDGTATLTGGQLDLTGSLHTIIANTGVAATIESVVGGAVGFIKDGSGTLVLTNANTYAGTTTINSGTLQMGNGGTTGSLPTSQRHHNQRDAQLQSKRYSDSGH